MLDLTWSQALRLRLRRQLLRGTVPDVVGVARRLAGVHAQLGSAAELICGVRSGLPPPAVRTALWDDRSLVKIWTVRGTLHLVPSEDLRWWVAALRVRESNRSFPPSWTSYHGLSPETMYRIVDAVGEVLPGRRLTREQLTQAVSERLGSAAAAAAMASSWSVVLKPAAAFGLLCFGPDEGRNVTFVAPSDWLGASIDEPGADEAMRWALLRFLDAYGPATADDFRRWWGDQRAGPANRLFKTHADELVAVRVEGEPMWLSPEAARDLDAVGTGTAKGGGVDLLPAFDPYVIAPRSARAQIIPAGREAEVSRQAGWISQTLLVDGRVAGVWTHEQAGADLQVRVSLFAETSAAQRRAAEARAETIAKLLDCTPVVTWAG